MVILANPVHPGEVLKEDFLDEFGLTAGKLAKALNVPRTRIERVVAKDRVVSPDTALRLSKFFGTTPEFWLNLQRAYDLSVAARDEELTDDLERILPLAS
ncbi:HigA family addiction module antitoxin [uncultured Tateyamaria sp.]|uniref:HigA family addiction module antitoxin n=1 Tax=uncultured Tateyamaria sp. TaxID=455651 RepID=UPI00260F5DC1|nr:HigA family addiction module antitoxin [uncultured Tateyamaria sp.]